MRLLEAAGLAVNALTMPSREHEDTQDASSTMKKRKETFTAATTQYFELLSSIDVGVRRQIIALEEAGIIPAEMVSKSSQPSQSTTSSTTTSRQSRGVVTGGGLGSLDVGWLNSRNDWVGKEKEAALWEEAAALMDQLRSEQGSFSESTGHARARQANPDGDIAMEGL